MSDWKKPSRRAAVGSLGPPPKPPSRRAVAVAANPVPFSGQTTVQTVVQPVVRQVVNVLPSAPASEAPVVEIVTADW